MTAARWQSLAQLRRTSLAQTSRHRRGCPPSDRRPRRHASEWYQSLKHRLRHRQPSNSPSLDRSPGVKPCIGLPGLTPSAHHAAETLDLERCEASPSTYEPPPPPTASTPWAWMATPRPVADFFRSRKIRSPDGACYIPLVCDQEGILWVVGHRLAHRARLRARTRKTLTLSCRPHPTLAIDRNHPLAYPPRARPSPTPS